MRNRVLISLLAVVLAGCASTPAPKNLFGDSTQLIVVTTPDWDATKGVLTIHERNNGTWTAIGDPIPVVVGRTGLAWGDGLPLPPHHDSPAKKEGDGKAPAGLFALTSLFGYEAQPMHADTSAHMPYITATPTVECVDDATSPQYNTIVDTQTVPKTWTSSENMLRNDDLYRQGVVVAHNSNPPVSGHGSCIFLHLWSGPDSTTAGCTAMSGENLARLTRWLDASRHPLLLQLTQGELEALGSLPRHP
jgi:D-alanyl-D-alanine dipeptidase